jgi:hypothetical protein
MRHREVGDVFVSLEVLTIDSAPGQKLIVFQAEPGSPSEDALAKLGGLATRIYPENSVARS